MSENDESIEEIRLDQAAPIQAMEEKSAAERFSPDIGVGVEPPQTNDEKVAEWITQSANAEETSVGENEDEVTSAILDNEQGDTTIPDNTSEQLLPNDISSKDVTTNDTNTVMTNASVSDKNRSVLRRMYQSQMNPPKQSYMRAMSSQRILSRDLRRVASASTQPESVPTVEASKPDKTCLTPMRKGILIGIFFGGIVVAIGLSVAVVFLIERSYTTVAAAVTTSVLPTTTTT